MKKIFSYSMATVATAIAAVILTRLLSPAEVITIDRPVDRVIHLDTTEARRYTARIDSQAMALKWYEKVFHTRYISEPAVGFTAMPPSDFMIPAFIDDTLRTGRDSGTIVRRELLFYDFPRSISFGAGELTIYTLNPGLRTQGRESFKQYRFKREADEFELLVGETRAADKLDGILVYWKEPALQWDGIDGEVGYSLQDGLYLGGETSVRVLGLFDIVPRVRASRASFNSQIGVRFNLIK